METRVSSMMTLLRFLLAICNLYAVTAIVTIGLVLLIVFAATSLPWAWRAGFGRASLPSRDHQGDAGKSPADDAET